jgi:pimeloyl-ACP methyl ester carboxylesterase
MSTIAVKSVRLASGLRLPYAESGYPGGTPVVFVHGIAESWRSFEPVLGLLPFSLHGFAPTQRGHSDADRPPAGYRPEDYAADLVGVLDALDIPRAVLVGAGTGAVAARIVAGGHPDRVAGLVMIGAPVAVGEGGPWLEGPLRPAREAGERLGRPDAEALLAGTVHGPVADGLLDVLAQEALRTPARVWRETARGLLEEDLRATLAGILVPTLAIWGAHDGRVGRADQQVITDIIHGSRSVVYEDAGHAVHWEQPERLTEELVRFAATVAADRV